MGLAFLSTTAWTIPLNVLASNCYTIADQLVRVTMQHGWELGLTTGPDHDMDSGITMLSSATGPTGPWVNHGRVLNGSSGM